MAYKYKGKRPDPTARYTPASDQEAAAKFAYFRQAEASINGGPVPTYPEVTQLPHRKPQPKAKCGTNGGYRRHRLDGTGPCEPCRAARVQYQRDYRARRAITGPAPRPYGSKPGPAPRPYGSKPGPAPKPLPPFNPELCGTMTGWRQHAKHGTERCRKCKDAHNAYHAQWRSKKRQAA